MEVVFCLLDVLLWLILHSVVQNRHTLVNCLRNLKDILVLCVINDEVVILLNELFHRVSIVKTKVGDAEFSRVVVNC